MKKTFTLPDKMVAMVLTGHGGFDKLEYRNDVRERIAAAKHDQAQRDFIAKKHTGKLVLVPPQEE